MKKAITTLLILLALITIAHSQTVIKVGAFNYYPAIFQDVDGEIKGIYVDALNELGKKENIQFTFVFGTWDEGLERIKTGKVDMLTSVAITEERLNYMDYASTPLLTVWSEVYINPKSGIRGVLDLEGKSVAVMKNDVNGEHLKLLTKKVEVNCTFIEATDFETVFRLIADNKVDAGVVSNTFGVPKSEEYGLLSSGIVFNPFDIFLTVKKNTNKELLNILNTYLHNWKHDRNSILNVARQKWSHGNLGVVEVFPKWVSKAVYSTLLIVLGLLLFIILLRYKVRMATKKLADNEKTFRKLFEDSADSNLLIDSNGLFVECNQAALDLLHMSRKQVIFLPPVSISPEYQPNGRKSKDAAIEMIELAYKKGLHRFDWTCINSMDEEFIVEVSLMPIIVKGQTMLHTTWREITERKKQEQELVIAKEKAEESEKHIKEKNEEYEALNEELREANENIIVAKEKAEESEENLRFLFENMIQGVVYHDSSGEIILANEAAASILGLSLDQLYGKSSLNPRWKSIHEDGTAYPGETHPVMITIKTKKPVKNSIMGIFIPEKDVYSWININSIPKFNHKNELIQVVVTFEDITEIRNAKERAEESETFLNETGEIAKIGGWKLDLVKQKLIWTKEVYRLHEVADDYKPTVEKAIDFYDNSSKIVIQKAVDEAIKFGKPFDVELGIHTAKGNHIFIRAIGEAQKDDKSNIEFITGTFQDITEKKYAEQELIKSQILLKSSLESPTDMIILSIDNNYNYLYFNECHKAAMAYAYGKDIKTGLNLLECLTSEEDRIKAKINYDKALNGESHITIQEFGDIEKSYYETRYNPIFDNKNEIIGATAFSADITERKQTELLLQEKNNEIEAQNEEYKQINEELFITKEHAEESDKLKTAFLQNISHEIRTPLNAIIGFSERINSPKITDEKRQFYADIIVKSGFQLLSIVNDILIISAIETGQEEVKKENVSINSLISDIEKVFKQQLEGKMVKLKAIKPLPNADAEILTDKTKLTQILTNLLSNAIKFTPVGEIEYGYTLKNTELEFFVKDNGIGIDNSKHEAIFERFVQAEKSIHIDYGGTGLGLSICKGFAELLGGKIWVESELGKGANFYFTIPYKPSKIESCDNTLSTNQEEIKQNENKTVLVAEDQIFNFMYLEEHLKELNYKVIHANNGKEAVEICRTNESIDIVLMDIRMPLMDGHKATMLIKEFRPNLKIIAQTAYATNVEIEKFGKAFDDYLTKPITSENLTKVLNKHLNPDK